MEICEASSFLVIERAMQTQWGDNEKSKRKYWAEQSSEQQQITNEAVHQQRFILLIYDS